VQNYIDTLLNLARLNEHTAVLQRKNTSDMLKESDIFIHLTLVFRDALFIVLLID